MLWFRLAMMLLGLIAGYGGGVALAVAGSPETATLNTVSLMLAGMFTGLLLAPRAEKFVLARSVRVRAWYDRLSPQTVAAATFGLIVALLLSVLLGNLLRALPFASWGLSLILTVVLAAFFITFAVRNADAFGALATSQVRRKPGGKLLDSSVIIDGRVLELSRVGFLEGELVVPAFVLRELQTLADSADPQKRTRGKRGLKVLEDLRAQRPLHVEDWDDPNLVGVDDKLIRLARETGARILTNDSNLLRIAKLHGAEALSIHEAAVALKPQVQAGDSLTITITKSGQQSGQGVGYMEDGTMVVVEDGLKLRNKPVRVVVVNNMQTNVGRMIFARLDKEQIPA
ncbi:PIN domain-containing protein [uncultured Deinococcus sp.]|uniref:PIN/TRAM domain-containing protein n=1 Tax=uncultured Deinococcus sp. TaxID=158789 RepID=UPI0025876ABC|nr:PIN domain-containing protein [uncultured Deinococcus sp.]